MAKKDRKIAKNTKNSTIKSFPGGRGKMQQKKRPKMAKKDRKIAKKDRKTALLNL